VEFKGQWHDDVWNASSVQLIEQYTKDWRADGRGIYVVLWFGTVSGKTLTNTLMVCFRKHPENCVNDWWNVLIQQSVHPSTWS